MNKKFKGIVKSAMILTMGLAVAASAQSESFCSTTSHSSTAQKKTVSRNEVGKIGNIGYELWDENGSGGNATFYDDGSMDCNITSAKDYLCRAGLSFNSDKTYDQLDGDMVAEFKLIKNSGQNVQYSYIGVYGWMEGVSGTQSNLVEYYVIDNTLSSGMPGDWIGDTKLGTITVDGGKYTVYRNTRTGPAIKSSGNVQFYQYFSVRTSMRDCGTINISEHMRQWEKLGLKMGKLYEAKVLGEAGNTGSNVTGGKMDFPHARVYVGEYVPPEPPKKIERKPFKGVAGQIPGTIQAEDYDEGNDGDSYGGATGECGEGNKDCTDYRGEDAALYLATVVKSGTGHAIGYTSADQWMEYTVEVAKDGEYDIAASVSNGSGKGSVTLAIDKTKIADLSFNGTSNDWDAYEDATGKAKLTAGKHTLRVTINNNSTNIDFIKFSLPGEDPQAIAPVVRLSDAGKSVQVFDIHGKFLGSVDVVNGASVNEAVAAKFQNSGIYLVKGVNGIQKIRVTQR